MSKFNWDAVKQIEELTAVSELEDTEENLRIATEDYNEGTPPEQTTVLNWGMRVPMDDEADPEPINPVPMMIGRDGSIHIYIMEDTDHMIGLYNIMRHIPAGTTVHMYLYAFSLVESAIFLQTCILDCPGIVHTHMLMVDGYSCSANLFFIWAFGDVPEPIPYGVIALSEPSTYLGYMGGTNTAVAMEDVDLTKSIISAWYDVALVRGLILPEETIALNDGVGVHITNFNDRLEKAQTLTAKAHLKQHVDFSNLFGEVYDRLALG